MFVRMNTGGLASTNSFLIGDEITKKAVLFDAPNDTVAPLLDEAERHGFDVIGLWLTHGHFDHIADHKIVTDRFPKARVLIHPLDAPKLVNPRSMMFPLPFTIPPRSPDETIEDGQTLTLGGMTARVIHTPGHAPGHVMFHFEKEGMLVGGDLIIMGAVGRTDLPGSNHADLETSVRKVMALPDETTLLPGHGQPSTLGDERSGNAYVRQILSI